jgi:hypothetical protein
MGIKSLFAGLCLLAINVLAAEAPAGCGFVSGSTFSNYSCPTNGTMEATIAFLDPVQGTAQCRYRDANGAFIVKQIKTGCALPKAHAGTAPAYSDGLISAASSTLATNVSQINNVTIDPEAYSTSALRDSITTATTELAAQGDSFQQSPAFLNLHKINSHSEYEKTVPSMLTGVLTLDGFYFEKIDGKVHYINEVGEVSINPDLITVSQSERYDFSPGVFEKIKSFFTGKVDAAGDVGVGSFNEFNPMKFMDQQVLGYYVYLSENLIAGYMTIVGIIFMAGAMWGSGYYGYKKFISKSGGEDDFKVNKLSYTLTAAAGFIFFTAPIIHEDVYTQGAIASAIYKSDDGLDTSTNYGYSTLAQQSVRYAAQAGTYFANIESDYAMQAFLALIQFKQGMFQDPTAIAGGMRAKLNIVEQKIATAAFNSNYVNKVCTPYFGIKNFNITKEQARNYQMTSRNQDSLNVLNGVGISAKGIDIGDCINKFNQIKTNTDSIIKSKKAIVAELNTYAQIYVSAGRPVTWLQHLGINYVTDASAARHNLMGDYLSMMIWTQNTFGWTASIVPHTSYLFFKNINAFEYGDQTLFDDYSEDEGAQTFVNGEKMQEGEDHDTALMEVGNAVSGLAGVTIGTVANNSTWFMVPGFQGIFSFTLGKLESLAFKGGTGEATSFGNNIKGIVDDVKGWVSKFPPFRMILAGIDSVFNKITGGDDYVRLQALVTTLAFVVSLWIVSVMISTVTVMTITVFITFKIVMFFVELIVFFMAAPVIGIYATIMSAQPQKYVANFTKQLSMLIVSPLLIVTASYLVLPISELFRGLFRALVTMIFYVFDKGGDYLNQDAPLTNAFDELSKITTLASMQGISEIFASLSVIAISYIIIFNYKEWFTKMIGLDGVMDHTKSAYGEMKQSSDKYISPL